ncbi:PucR family transcriptional regulator [Streptomyces sp. NPDC050658]|uniref:PucR family transcriptional regulator n=1 Tax=unclassified Streptomyces TaxID=2593676 RepID=UPI003435CB81
MTWRRYVEISGHSNTPPAQMYALAEALFAYADELVGHTVQGYLAEQERTMSSAQRHRESLLSALTGTVAPSRRTVVDLAHTAGWPLPDSVQAVALTPARRPAHSGTPLPPGRHVLGDDEGLHPYWILPDPKREDLLALERITKGRRVAVGPPVPPHEAGLSLRSARQLLDLAERGLIVGAPVLQCADHLPKLLLTRDDTIVHALVERHLTPLQELTARQRERCVETLTAWLQHRGSPLEMAQALHIHPQTVRYRLRQIAKQFGPALNDPDLRFELEIALRAHKMLGGEPERPPAGRPRP